MPRFYSSVRFTKLSSYHLYVSTLAVINLNLKLYPTVLKIYMHFCDEYSVWASLHAFGHLYFLFHKVLFMSFAHFLLGSFSSLNIKVLIRILILCVSSELEDIALDYLLSVVNRVLFLENCFPPGSKIVRFFFILCGVDVRFSFYLRPQPRITKIFSRITVSYFYASVCTPSGIYFGIFVFSHG